jgi:ABC-type multidrug transport system fused ATPase/permease subunit
MPGGLRLTRFVLAGLGEHFWRPLLLALCIVGASASLSAAMPLLFGALVEQLGANRADARAVIILVLVYCGFHLANGLIIETRTLVFGLLDNRSFFNLSRAAYARALRLPFSFHLAEETGVTWQRVNQGAESGSTLLHHGLGGLLPFGSQLLLVFAILTLNFGPVMAVIVVVAALIAPQRSAEALISLKDVDLRRGSAVLLRNITFEIPERSVVGIVGWSGAGKSSLCHVIAGLVAPSSGRCSIDGMDAHELQAKQRWPLIGRVPQSVPVLDDTLAFNVSLGRGEGGRDALCKVLRDCQLEGLLTRINGDLSVRFGDGGIRLSGGEGQRLGLARAIHPDPRILILDEATANLDSETEKQIFAWLRQQQGRRTIIIVSHKLPLVEWADLVLYLEDGEIKERGSHRQLLALAGGGYTRLWRSQVESINRS